MMDYYNCFFERVKRMSNPILSKNSNNKVNSPEQLNDYIKASSVGVWVVLSVIIILLVSILIWGFFGSLKTTVNTVGVADNGTVVCYLESSGDISVGDEVSVNGQKGEVSAVSSTPVSAHTLASQYDEYTFYSLNPSDWSYAVEIKCDDCDDGINSVKIIYDSVHPISFITG